MQRLFFRLAWLQESQICHNEKFSKSFDYASEVFKNKIMLVHQPN